MLIGCNRRLRAARVAGAMRFLDLKIFKFDSKTPGHGAEGPVNQCKSGLAFGEGLFESHPVTSDPLPTPKVIKNRQKAFNLKSSYASTYQCTNVSRIWIVL